MVYGKSAIKKIGLYDKITEILKASVKNITEHAGIKLNPTYEQVLEGARLVRENNIDLAAISVPYYKYIAEYGLDKFVRFAKNVWEVGTDTMTKEAAADAGIEKMGEFIKMLKLPTTLRALGATEDMLPLIANSTVLGEDINR